LSFLLDTNAFSAIVRTGGDPHSGIVVGVVDELIAATALTRGLVLVTRNVRHFEQSGCPLPNPWPG
jgi:predicted nucleic acid-binding protein